MTCTPSPRPFWSVWPTNSMLRAETGFMARLPQTVGSRHIDEPGTESNAAGPRYRYWGARYMDEKIAVDRDEIAETERLIRPRIRRTPVIEVDGADFGLDRVRLSFKLELLQHAGSFKTRGAFANLLTREIPPAGVVAASGGNHGAAVAYAAMTLKVPAKIFVPTVSWPAKIDRIREYGADLTVGADFYAEALAASEAWARQTGAMPVHAFDQNETIMGQGTLALELEQQVP